MTKTLSFETIVENGYIRIPFESASGIRNAKVTLKWSEEAKQTKQRPKMPSLGIDMTGYKFDREEANAR
jgi:hypothetical protein